MSEASRDAVVAAAIRWREAHLAFHSTRDNIEPSWELGQADSDLRLAVSVHINAERREAMERVQQADRELLVGPPAPRPENPYGSDSDA